METLVNEMTKWSGITMIAIQVILLLGNLYIGKYAAALYWVGAVQLTIGVLWMSGWKQ